MCVLWLGECVCANAKFVKNYRVAIALSLFEFSKPNCYVVGEFFFLGLGCNREDLTMIDKRDRKQSFPPRDIKDLSGCTRCRIAL